MLKYPHFEATEVEFHVESKTKESVLRASILDINKSRKAASDPKKLEQDANYNAIYAEFVLSTHGFTVKLNKTDIAEIRTLMVDKLFSRVQRNNIKNLVSENKVKLGNRDEIAAMTDEWFQFTDAKMTRKDVVYQLEGKAVHISKYEYLVKCYLRDYKANYVGNIVDIAHEVEGVDMKEANFDKNEVYTWEKLMKLPNQAAVCKAIQLDYDTDRWALDHDAMWNTELEKDAVIILTNTLGGEDEGIVVSNNPLEVSFDGDTKIIHSRIYTIKK